MQRIKHKNIIYALIVKAKEQFTKQGVDFRTQNKDLLQIGFLKHNTNHKIKSHIHKKKTRKLDYCTEVLVIRKGKVKVFFYDEKGKDINKSKILEKNDIIVLFKGGHGFKIIKKCEILEIKQGPYLLDKDKKLFNEK